MASLRLDDFASLDTAGADANALCAALDLGLDWAKVDVPAAAGDVVGVRNIISELRTFAADLANLSHDLLHASKFSSAGLGHWGRGLKTLVDAAWCENPMGFRPSSQNSQFSLSLASAANIHAKGPIGIDRRVPDR
jgi:hypothetical protein